MASSLISSQWRCWSILEASSFKSTPLLKFFQSVSIHLSSRVDEDGLSVGSFDGVGRGTFEGVIDVGVTSPTSTTPHQDDTTKLRNVIPITPINTYLVGMRINYIFY